MKVKHKILLTFSLISICSGVAFFLSSNVLTSLEMHYEDFQNESLVSMLASQELSHLESEVRFHLTKMVSVGQVDEEENIKKHFDEIALELDKYQLAYENAAKIKADCQKTMKVFLTDFNEHLKNLILFNDEVMRLMHNGSYQKKDLFEKLDLLGKAGAEISGNVLPEEKMEIESDARVIHQKIKTAKVVLLGASIVVFLLAAFLAFYLANYLTTNINILKQNTERIAAGEFSARLQANSSDEFGALAKQINEMAQYIEDSYLEAQVSEKKLWSSLQELQLSEERYKAIFESAGDFVLVLESISDGLPIIVDANLVTLNAHGYTREELIGKPITFLEQENRGEIVKDRNQKLKEINDFSRFETEHVRKDGSVFPVDVLVTVIQKKNERTLLLAIERDITERKYLEQEKEQMNMALIHSGKLASIGTLAAGVAHEINNPLTIITSYAEILQSGTEFAAQKHNEIIGKILAASTRIAKIVKGLRTYARQDREVLEVVDVHQCINESLSLVQNMYEKDNVLIETRLHSTPLFVDANLGKLQQVIMNLLSNARDVLMSKNGGLIKICTQEINNDILIEVVDNGDGIPPDIINHIFDPFFTTKDPGSGTGLGLSICHSIIESFGGKIRVESQEHMGATFNILLPKYSKDKNGTESV